MAHIIAVEHALPANYYPQGLLLEALQGLWPEPAVQRRLERLFQRVGVEGRYLALPMARYLERRGQASRNADWRHSALELGSESLWKLFARTGLAPTDVQMIATSTVTGLAVPSLEALLTHRMGLARDIRRVPLFGLGCAGGAAGIAQVADYLQAHPEQAAVLLAVELCSLTLQPSDISVANLIGTGLFGDGAAAVLLVGDDHPLASQSRARVMDSASWLFEDTERVMGWDVEDDGFRLVLSPDVPHLAREALPAHVEGLLDRHGLTLADVDTWVAHPGGPAILDGLEQGLNLRPRALDVSRRCLAQLGNLSSASVLVILQETLRSAAPRPCTPGVIMAMGPGFAAELVLVQW